MDYRRQEPCRGLVQFGNYHWNGTKAHMYQGENTLRLRHTRPSINIQGALQSVRGKTNEDLNVTHCNTANTKKWVNPFDELLKKFKGEGHCVTMDSAYMGDIMAHIGWEECLINMVGTSQSNHTGADVKDVKEAMKRVPTNQSYSNTRTSRSDLHCGWIIASSKQYPTSILQLCVQRGVGY